MGMVREGEEEDGVYLDLGFGCPSVYVSCHVSPPQFLMMLGLAE